jgi:hypothetical protein
MGFNGLSEAHRALAKFLSVGEMVPRDDTGLVKERGDRFQRVLRAVYDSALIPGKDGAADRRLLVEQMAGRAPEAPSGLLLAEHFRGVEKDRIATVIAILGPKLRDKTPEELKKYLDNCTNSPGKFLEMANRLMGEQVAEPEPEQTAELLEQKPEGEP